MYSILFFIFFPLTIAIASIFIKKDLLRNILITAASLILIAASIFFALKNFKVPICFFNFESEMVKQLMYYVEIAFSFFIVYVSFKYKNIFTGILGVTQLILIVIFEKFYGLVNLAPRNMFFDQFSLIMMLIIGVIGSLICIYALGYMKTFHQHHPEIPDERNLFFFVIFLFLTAMFGIIFSNNLLWFYFFWEITTLCSFVLIGYTKTAEAITNAFRALLMNLIGGVFFFLGIMYLYISTGIIELDRMLSLGYIGLILIPVIFFCIAGLTKAAQMPFSSWLLGAMVAPTPISALLHSSTMVKAGVYLLVKLAPLLNHTVVGLMVALIGAVTFLIASFIAISQSDAKKVLAYSTIANLGLVVLCAGIGSPAAVWAAILLIIFHAIAKALLFLCVGTVDHQIGSRDIEDMQGLVVRMPKVAGMMLIGMAGMFLAPFGMLISKWAVLKALLDVNPLLSVIVIFGSSATLFFWVKWMGKLITVLGEKENIEKKVDFGTWVALYSLAISTVGICLLFPVVSHIFIEPYLIKVFATIVIMSKGNITIMLFMMGLVLLFPISTIMPFIRKTKIVDSYMAGVNAQGSVSFHGSIGTTKEIALRGYFMERFFGEEKLFKIGVYFSYVFLLVMMWEIIL